MCKGILTPDVVFISDLKIATQVQGPNMFKYQQTRHPSLCPRHSDYDMKYSCPPTNEAVIYHPSIAIIFLSQVPDAKLTSLRSLE